MSTGVRCITGTVVIYGSSSICDICPFELRDARCEYEMNEYRSTKECHVLGYRTKHNHGRVFVSRGRTVRRASLPRG